MRQTKRPSKFDQHKLDFELLDRFQRIKDVGEITIEVVLMLNQLRAAAPIRIANHQTKSSRASYEHVFVGQGGTSWIHNPGNLLRAFYRVCKAAKIPGAEPGSSIDIHAWRGTFTTLALDRGANLKAVSEMVGHGSTKITEKVYNKATERMRQSTVGSFRSSISGPGYRTFLSKRRAQLTICRHKLLPRQGLKGTPFGLSMQWLRVQAPSASFRVI